MNGLGIIQNGRHIGPWTTLETFHYCLALFGNWVHWAYLIQNFWNPLCLYNRQIGTTVFSAISSLLYLGPRRRKEKYINTTKHNIKKKQNFCWKVCDMDLSILPLTFRQTSTWLLLGNYFSCPPKGILWINSATFWEQTQGIRILQIKTKERGN